MKRFPKKTMMAVIILSCGFMNAEPSAQSDRAKRMGFEARHLAASVTDPAPAPHPARADKVLALREDRPSW